MQLNCHNPMLCVWMRHPAFTGSVSCVESEGSCVQTIRRLLGLARALTALLSFAFFHREVVVAVLCLDSTGCALAATTRPTSAGASLKDRVAHPCRTATAFGFPDLIPMLGGIFSLNADAQERVTRDCYERYFSRPYEADAELRWGLSHSTMKLVRSRQRESVDKGDGMPRRVTS